MLDAKLLVLAPAEIAGTEFKLQLPVTLGRGRDAKIKLVHGQISRLHCEVSEQNNQLVVRDLGSLNGTFVNGERIAGEQVLPPAGLLNVGAVTFKAVYGVMPNDSDDSTVDFGAPRTKDTVTTTKTVMATEMPFPVATPAADEVPDFSALPDFAQQPTAPPPPQTPPPIPTGVAPPASPAPAPKAAPTQPPQPTTAASGSEDDVADWLIDADEPTTNSTKDDNDDLQAFFKGLK